MHQTGIPQYTILLQKCAHMCTFLLQNGALWDMRGALWDLWDWSIYWYNEIYKSSPGYFCPDSPVIKWMWCRNMLWCIQCKCLLHSWLAAIHFSTVYVFHFSYPRHQYWPVIKGLSKWQNDNISILMVWREFSNLFYNDKKRDLDIKLGCIFKILIQWNVYMCMEYCPGYFLSHCTCDQMYGICFDTISANLFFIAVWLHSAAVFALHIISLIWFYVSFS